MLKISIVNGFHQPQSRQTKNGIMWWQDAYAHLGGPFPAQIKVPLRDAAAAYAVGEYELGPENFRVGKFGDLEINRFEMRLTPASGKPVSAVAGAK